MRDTFSKADLHVHSSFSFDVPDLAALHPRALFEAALGHPDPERRLDWFALTDHDTMAGWEALVRELPEADRALVIPAVEHTLLDPSIGFTIHTNLYGLDPDTYARLRAAVRTLDELCLFCQEHGILYQYNHPTWWERVELRRGQVDFARVPEIAARFPVLELNAARTPAQNLITAGLAAERGLPLTASSDTHTGAVGRGWTAAPGRTAAEFLGAVWRGEGSTHLDHLSHEALVDEAHGLIDEFMDRGHIHGPAGREASSPAQAWLEHMALLLVRSRWVQQTPAARESLRALLKHASVPILKAVMGHEHRLDRRLADSELRTYLTRAHVANAA